MKRLFVATTALGLAFAGSAFAQSTTQSTTMSGNSGSDLWASMTCSDFIGTSAANQRDIVASIEAHRQSMDDNSSAEADAEKNDAINSGADVSMGTRGVDQSGTAALTAEGATEGNPAGTNYERVSVDDLVEACQSSPDSRVSEVVDQEMTR